MLYISLFSFLKHHHYTILRICNFDWFFKDGKGYLHDECWYKNGDECWFANCANQHIFLRKNFFFSRISDSKISKQNNIWVKKIPILVIIIFFRAHWIFVSPQSYVEILDLEKERWEYGEGDRDEDVIFCVAQMTTGLVLRDQNQMKMHTIL